MNNNQEINITTKPTDNQNRRATAKGLIIYDHPSLGKVVIISKEKDGFWSLLGGGIDQGETIRQALEREINEELGLDVEKTKSIGKVYTKKQIHNILSVKAQGKVTIDSNELMGIGFYPLEDKHEKKRSILEKNMHFHAKKALQHFKENHSYTTYEGSEITITLITKLRLFKNSLLDVTTSK